MMCLYLFVSLVTQGIGAVMSHVFPDGNERPISFASRTLSSKERNYSQIKREALAHVYRIKKYLPLNQKIQDGK